MLFPQASRGRWVLPTVALLAACGRAPAERPIRIGLSSAPSSLDPHRTNESVSYIVNSNIYDTLVKTDADLTITGSLARNWINPDDTTWVFDLQPRVTFHDGRPLTAADVVHSLLRVRDDPQTEWIGLSTGVKDVSAPEPQRVVIRTAFPFPLLLRYLAAIAIVPGPGAKADDLQALPVGTGPYRFASSQDDRRTVRLERWEGYWGRRPAIPSVEFRALPATGERVAALQSGAVDMLTDVPLGRGDVETIPGVRVLGVPGLRQMSLVFDVLRPVTPHVSPPGNPFRDLRVRRAFQLAVDPAAIVATRLSGFAEEATQFGPPGVVGFEPGLKPPKPNLEEARRLMAEAGWADGFSVTLDGTREVYLGDTEVAEAVVANLSRIGVRARTNGLDKTAFFQKLEQRDTSLYLISWSCLSADMQEIFDYLLHTPGPARGWGQNNRGGYSNPRVDALAEQAARTMDHVRRAALLRAASAAAFGDVPWVPIYVQRQVYALRAPFRWTPRQDKKICVADISIDQP